MLVYYQSFGEGTRYWAVDMIECANNWQILLVETLLDRLRDNLPNGDELIHSTIAFKVTDRGCLDVLHSKILC